MSITCRGHDCTRTASFSAMPPATCGPTTAGEVRPYLMQDSNEIAFDRWVCGGCGTENLAPIIMEVRSA